MFLALGHYSTGIAVQVPGVPAVVQTHPGEVVAVTPVFQHACPWGKVVVEYWVDGICGDVRGLGIPLTIGLG